MKTLVKSMLLCCCLLLASSGRLIAQEHGPHGDSGDHPFGIAPIVALDECDPTTFNAAIGPDFCKNVALAPLGFATTFQDLFAKAAAGTPARLGL